MSNRIKVILDTNIFHDFNRSSKVLYHLMRSGRIRVYITPMLLEECFRLILHPSAASDLKSILQFILDISSERWFEDNFEIFKTELTPLPRRKDYQYLTADAKEILIENIRNTIQGGRMNNEMEHLARAHLAQNQQKASNLRAAGLDMRKAIAQNLKKLGAKHKSITETWEAFRSKALNKWGIELIKRKDCYSKTFKLPAILLWLTCKKRCPYFYDWVQGMLYIQFYAMKYPQLEIDENAQSDIQHLVFLREVDAIISEEKGFMRKAWEDLYAPLGKEYLNLSEASTL